MLHLTSPKSYLLICLNTWYFLSYQKVHIILKELLTVGVVVAHLFKVLGLGFEDCALGYDVEVLGHLGL